MSDAQPIAGWYPDPDRPGSDRWWTGAAWSDSRRNEKPAERNTLALVGFIVSLSGILIPLVLNSLAGGIISSIALRRSRVLLTGRGLSMAGILIGFIWGAIVLLLWVGVIIFIVWISSVASNANLHPRDYLNS